MTDPAAALSEHFDALFTASADPWGYRTRWYERRKRAAVLAALPHARYRRAYEPGCAGGELTRELASRCDELLASDASHPAVEHACQSLADLDNVQVSEGRCPDDWPDGRFDLIVLSELGYYLEPEALTGAIARIGGSLEAGGVFLACHWRHAAADLRCSADDLHARLGRDLGLRRVVHHLEDDFVLDVWSEDGRSVAQREGLA